MEEIRIQFTYDIADDQYYTTNDLKLTATAEYVGPAVQYWEFDVDTDKWTGNTISFEQHQTYNERLDDGKYSVEVDCTTNPLLCSLASTQYVNQENWPESSEEIPETIPYVRNNPALPDHTYEKTAIFYSPEKQEFLPLEWKKPWITWEQLLQNRNNQLTNSDRHISEDLPESLYVKLVEYRNHLRNMPVTYGVSWYVTIDNGGSDYAVGDKLSINDPRLKAGIPMEDLMLTVTEVNNGSITAVNVSSHRALHIKEATSFSEVYFTTNGFGHGANLTVTKNRLIDPWKISAKLNPLVP